MPALSVERLRISALPNHHNHEYVRGSDEMIKSIKRIIRRALFNASLEDGDFGPLTHLVYGESFDKEALATQERDKITSMDEVTDRLMEELDDYSSDGYHQCEEEDSRKIGDLTEEGDSNEKKDPKWYQVRRLKRYLNTVIALRIDEAAAVKRGEVPASRRELLGKDPEDTERKVKTAIKYVLLDRPKDFSENSELVPLRRRETGRKYKTRRIIAEEWTDLIQWCEEDVEAFVRPDGIQGDSFLREALLTIMMLRRRMFGQLSLFDAQKEDNPRLVRWFKGPLNLMADFSPLSFFAEYDIKTHLRERKDGISHDLYLIDHEYKYFIYYSELGLIYDSDSGEEFYLNDILRMLERGQRNMVIGKLKLY